MADNFAAFKSLAAKAEAYRLVVRKMAEFYANGGPGNSNPVVADRFGGSENSRFAPLSTPYAKWKQGVSKEMNAKQKVNFAHGSKLLNVESKQRHAGVDVHNFHKGTLPILILSGALRAAIVGRQHEITVSGDTATISFEVPSYGKYLHTGTSKMPARSPVALNAHDIERVKDFGDKFISAYKATGVTLTAFGGGKARVL